MSNLKTDKNLDKHLRPVKSDVENTSLQLATEGNGAKVTGDLNITGGISINGDADIDNGNLKIDSGKYFYFDGGDDTYITETVYIKRKWR